MKGRVTTEKVFNPKTKQIEVLTTYLLNDKEVTKAEFDAAFPSKLAGLFGSEVAAMCRPSGWPMVSMGMGCHPADVPTANEVLKKHGSAARHRKDGRLEIPTELERRRVAKIKGMKDNNSFV